MRHTCAVLAALWLGLSGAAARAGEVTIQFDFSGSTLTMLGGILSIPPGGSITAATGSATFLANGPTQISGGPARLEGLDVAATINQNVLGQALVTGDILAQQLATPAYGQLSAGLGNAYFTNILLDVDVDANCVGAGCPFIGTFPLNILGTFTTANLNAVLGNLETLSAATLMATLPVSLSGFSGVLTLVGSEVSRSFNPVPEPGTFSALALGLVALALVARVTRRPL
jgi:hypothetical protein